MEEVAQGVHRLGTNYINFFLVEDGAKVTLVDTGLPGYWSQLPAALESLHRSIADIDVVLLTHSHVDHIGNADRLINEAGTRTLIHPADRDAARRSERVGTKQLLPHMWRLYLVRYSLHLLRSGATSVPPLQEPGNLSDGETLDVPGKPRVIHLPGHTPGSCGLFFEQRSVLFTGDALVTLDTLRGRIGPAVFTSPFSADTDRAYESLARLEGIEADVMLPGHGEPWTGGVRNAIRLARSSPRK
jgi:glyoxylase-like metal-dependent hydrolase (beta-lactamase superfamily II)